MSVSYYRSRLPLSVLAQVDNDAGGRSTSNIQFIHLSMSTPTINGIAFVSLHKAKSKCFDARSQTVSEASKFVTVDKTGVPYGITTDTLIEIDLENPHLYEMDVHLIISDESTVPQVTALSVADDGNWHEIGTQGQLKAYPYANVGPYYSKKNVSSYVIGEADGSIINLGKASGISVIDGEVAVYSRQYQTFLGLQMWLKSDKDYDTSEFELSVGDGTVKFTIQQYGDNGATARFSVSENTLNTNFTLYQDGQRVSVPTLRNGVWTSIGVAINSPIQPGINVPRLTFGPGVAVKDIVFYGGDNLAKIMNFRTWAQVLYSDNTEMHWEDWADKTWQEVYISESDVPAMDIGKQYRGTIGTNRYVVGEDEGEESRTLLIIDDGITITSKEIVQENGENLVLSAPSWKGVGTYSA